MEDVLVWVFWAIIIGGSIASSASKAKKKREEEARRAAAASASHGASASAAASSRGASATASVAGASSGAGSGAGSSVGRDGSSKSFGGGSFGGGSFGRVLEELSRQLSEQPSPTVVLRPFSQHDGRTVARPASAAQSAETSHDYYSLESEYDAMYGREYRGEYGAEYSAEAIEDEVTAYERLADQRARRSSLTQAMASGGGASAASVAVAAGTARTAASSVASISTAPSIVAAQELSADTTNDFESTTLRELLGGDFDLRRAVIEAEILTPKYAAGY